MQTVSATYAKQNFAAILDLSQREPVQIRRHERNVAVLISNEEYERMNRERWAEFNRLSASAAEEAKANGLTEEILAEILAES
jgi:prevent-host-death family protein